MNNMWNETIFLICGIAYFILMNLIAFVLYGSDKRKAKKNQWRIPEATLILVAFLGGAIGAQIGRKIWHHKTQKIKFRICIPIAIVWNLLLIVAFAFGAYTLDYYHAKEYALDNMNSDSDLQEETQVTVEDSSKNYVVFRPEKPTEGMIFYPGGKVQCEAYAPLMKALAKQGVLCVLCRMPANLAVFKKNAADGIRENYPEVKRWYMAGHSLGGSMAASYANSHVDEFEGVILLASYSIDDLSKSNLKVISIYGSEDKVLNMEKYEENKKNLPADFVETIIPGGIHSFFANYGVQQGDGAASISNEDQIEQTVAVITEQINQ